MKKILIYSSLICPYCIAAKKIFENQKLKYTEILIDNNPKEKKKMISLSGGRVTVPQIFFDDDHIGGYVDLTRLIENKDLIGMLEDEKN
ncbi:MAG: glutaredoxin 3 [Alphaproteobacteria bacterium]